MRKVIFIFIDGLGIGDKRNNPFSNFSSDIFSYFKNDFKNKEYVKINDGYIYPLDASLGYPGIPQSATGQTSIFTGINAVKLLQKHLFGFPNKKLRKNLIKDNMLIHFKNKGYKTAFINCYPYYADQLSRGILKINESGDFKVMEEDKLILKSLRRVSVTTIMALSINQYFFNVDDLLDEKTIYQDFTNRLLLKKRIDKLTEFSSETAGRIIADSLKDKDFILYEYFQTDKAGHRQDKDYADIIAHDLDTFIKSILDNIDKDNTDVFIASDHGNFEDLSKRMHTENKVPFYIFTKKKLDISINSLTDIYNVVDKIAGE